MFQLTIATSRCACVCACECECDCRCDCDCVVVWKGKRRNIYVLCCKLKATSCTYLRIRDLMARSLMSCTVSVKQLVQHTSDASRRGLDFKRLVEIQVAKCVKQTAREEQRNKERDREMHAKCGITLTCEISKPLEPTRTNKAHQQTCNHVQPYEGGSGRGHTMPCLPLHWRRMWR